MRFVIFFVQFTDLLPFNKTNQKTHTHTQKRTHRACRTEQLLVFILWDWLNIFICIIIAPRWWWRWFIKVSWEISTLTHTKEFISHPPSLLLSFYFFVCRKFIYVSYFHFNWNYILFYFFLSCLYRLICMTINFVCFYFFFSASVLLILNGNIDTPIYLE